MIKNILKDHNDEYTNEDLLTLFTITGGVPWYVALLMDKGHVTKNGMLGYLTEDNSPFINEGKNMLIEEFGPDYGMYFSILTCIAGGMRTRGEIEGELREKNISSYLDKLERYYGLITRSLPIFAKETSKKSKYRLSDNFLTLWFRFFYKYQAIIANDALSQLDTIIRRDYETVAGFMLERYFERKLRETGRFTRIGGYWDRKGENEIDIVAINEFTCEGIAVEVKRNELKISMHILAEKVSKLPPQQFGKYHLQLQGLSLNDM